MYKYICLCISITTDTRDPAAAGQTGPTIQLMRLIKAAEWDDMKKRLDELKLEVSYIYILQSICQARNFVKIPTFLGTL